MSKKKLGSGTEAMNTLGDRHNTGKPELSLILEAPLALDGLAQVLMYGAKKYSRSNWRKGLEHKSIVDSLMRHLVAYSSGEAIDPESNLPHVDHVLCNALFLSEMVRLRPDLNGKDRNVEK